jgi:hypothetical protein
VCFCLVLGVFLGCDNRSQDRVAKIMGKENVSTERKDSLREAFAYLPQLIRLSRTAALKEIRLQLNTWANSVENPKDWKTPELLLSIDGPLRTIDFAQRLDKIEFGEPECEYLLQCQMLSQVSKWVLDRDYHDILFRDWLESKKTDLGLDDRLKLESTLKLFDWVVTNVGLEGEPKDVEQLVTNPVVANSDTGPIYRQLPWQTMMFARGDAWQRARLFTQMLFVQGIDSCVLALPGLSGATENAALRLWCVGVPIAGEIYLFEPRWGLPIPSQSGPGIATLKEARSNPQVLRRAKLPGLFEYPVEPKDLEQLIALIDCEPFAVSKSMYAIQRSLVGDNRIRLSMDADAFQAQLATQVEGVNPRLWNAPWLAYVYNKAVREQLKDNTPFSIQYMGKYGALVQDTPISRSRMLHFQGKFESTVDEIGALRSYMDFRVDEQTLKELLVNPDVQKELGFQRAQNEDYKEFEFRLANSQRYLRQSKFDIGMYLAMASMAIGKPTTAIDWLKKRTLEMKGSEHWRSHAQYLLGRNYEETGQFKLAEEAYKFEASAQAAGNRIRLRNLRQMFPDSFEGN